VRVGSRDRRWKTWHVRRLGTPRAKRQIEVLQGGCFDLFSFDDDDATFDNRIIYRPPTQWLVEPRLLLSMMELEHACCAVFGRLARCYAILHQPDDRHEHFEFDGYARSRSATSNARKHARIMLSPSPRPRQSQQACLLPSMTLAEKEN
jgi:hypothetical protein